MKRQLFIISKEAFDALSIEEVLATAEGLKEVGLFHLPYPEVDVWLNGDNVAYSDYNSRLDGMISKGLLLRHGNIVRTNYGPGHWTQYSNISLSHINYVKHIVVDKNNLKLKPSKILVNVSPVEAERDAVARTLIVLLTTRNVVKSTVINKSAKLRIGKGIKKYEYVTTISVPKILADDEEHLPSGNEKAPHLRRGHARRQHYGVGNALVKMKWIDPVFVNADKNWIATRTAYHLG